MAKPNNQTWANFSPLWNRTAKQKKLFTAKLAQQFQILEHSQKETRLFKSFALFFFFFFNLNYTGYNKQVTNFLYLKTETLAGGDVTKYVGWRVRNTFFRDRKEHWRLGTRTEVEEPFPKRYLPAILRFLNSALTLWAFCIPFKINKKNKGCF